MYVNVMASRLGKRVDRDTQTSCIWNHSPRRDNIQRSIGVATRLYTTFGTLNLVERDVDGKVTLRGMFEIAYAGGCVGGG
jgi:hypothetical protein